jgi:transcriptional regulator with XRE-family HTH domain
MAYTGPLEGMGEALRVLRRRKGLTQEAAAERMGTTQSEISKFENDANFQTETLDRLLAIYEASLLDLAELVGLRPSPGGGTGGKTLDGDAIRRELTEAMRRLGIEPGPLAENEENDGKTRSGGRHDATDGAPFSF